MTPRSALRAKLAAGALALAVAAAGAPVASADPAPAVPPAPVAGSTATPATTTPTTTVPAPPSSPVTDAPPTPVSNAVSAAAAAAAAVQGVDPMEGLGDRSPTCADAGSFKEIDPEAQRNCVQSGSIANAHPSDNYGLDDNVSTSLTDPSSWIASALQWLIGMVWLGLVYLVKGVLSVFEWAFSTNIYLDSEAKSKQGLDRMYAVFGGPWMTFALAVAGMWGLWNGLVRRKAIETLSGLAAAVGLMLIALVIIHDPRDTVGHLSRLTDTASLSALSAASTGTVDTPVSTLADADRNLFDAIVLRPWCALEFGDVPYCIDHQANDPSVADIWLSFTPNSGARQDLYARTNGSIDSGWTNALNNSISNGWAYLTGGTDGLAGEVANQQRLQGQAAKDAYKVVTRSPGHVLLQQAYGTMPRFAILIVIGIGVLGACALIGSIAIRLLIHGGVMTLVLLLLAPVVLLAPAFGDSGRRLFVAWMRKLLAAIVSKFVYAVVLAVVILVSNILAELPLGGWLPSWIVASTFWWSVFLRRRELLAMVSMDSGRSGNALSSLYYMSQFGRTVRRTASGLTVRPVRAATRPLRRNAYGRQRGAQAFAREQAQDFAGRRAREVTAQTQAADYAEATALLAGAPADRARQGVVRGRLVTIDARLDGRGPRPLGANERPRLEEERAGLAAEDRAIGHRISSLPRARAVAARGPVAPPMDARDVQRWSDQRLSDIRNQPWNHATNLRAAGIDPRAHQAAVQRSAGGDQDAGDEVRDQHRRVIEQQRRDEVLLTAARERRDGPPVRGAQRRERDHAVAAEYQRESRGFSGDTPRAARERRIDAEHRQLRAERRRGRVFR